MTDLPVTAVGSAGDDESIDFIDPPVTERTNNHGDALLEILLDVLATEGAGIAVTLSVGGTLVEGQAVPFDRWRSGLIEGIRTIGDYGQSVATALDELWLRDDRTRAGFPPAAEFEREFVYLVDVEIDDGRRYPTWRVRFDRIDGWTIGRRSAPRRLRR